MSETSSEATTLHAGSSSLLLDGLGSSQRGHKDCFMDHWWPQNC